MVATRGLIARRVHLDTQSPSALRAEPRWIEFAPTREIGMLIERGTAPPAVRLDHPQMAFDSAPIGIWRSANIWRSSSGERPSVVR